MLKDLILELFVALLLMAILEPIILWFSRYKIPRALSILVTYVLIIGILGGVIALIVPAVVDQTTSFVEAFPGYLTNLGITSVVGSDILKGFVNNNAGSAPGAIFQFTSSIVGSLVAIVAVLVFAFYMLNSRDRLDDQLGTFFGEEKKRDLGKLIDTLERKLGGWARGELILMFSIGLATYIGLRLLGIPFALPLALLAGILEIVPFLGPIISAVPSVLIGFGISPITGVGVAAMAFLIQQLESYILVPKVMQKSVGVSPLITLISLAVGVRLAGVVGAIISVPVVITLQVLAKKYLTRE